MKLRELISSLQQIEAQHPDPEVCFQTVSYRWEKGGHVETVQSQHVIGINYGIEGADYCMVGLSSRQEDEAEYKSRRAVDLDRQASPARPVESITL